MSHPTVLTVGAISDGDKLRWTTPTGCKLEGKVVKLIGHSGNDGNYAIDFFTEAIVYPNGYRTSTFQRSVPLQWITHLNKKRVKNSRQGTGLGVRSVLSAEASDRQIELTMTRKEPEMAATKKAATRKPAAKKSTVKKTVAKPAVKKTASKGVGTRIPHGSRKSLDQMSASHRAHVEKWEPHLENLKAEFVWVAAARFAKRDAEGLYYVAIKRGQKDYAIVSYNIANPKPITKRNLEAEGFASSLAMMEAFKEFRKLAKEERQGTKPSKVKVPAKTKAASKVRAKTAAKKPVRKAAPKRAAKKA